MSHALDGLLEGAELGAVGAGVELLLEPVVVKAGAVAASDSWQSVCQVPNKNSSMPIALDCREQRETLCSAQLQCKTGRLHDGACCRMRSARIHAVSAINVPMRRKMLIICLHNAPYTPLKNELSRLFWTGAGRSKGRQSEGCRPRSECASTEWHLTF